MDTGKFPFGGKLKYWHTFRAYIKPRCSLILYPRVNKKQAEEGGTIELISPLQSLRRTYDKVAYDKAGLGII